MTEEEKKAIEDLRRLCIEVLREDDLSTYDNYSPSEKMTMVDIALNLIKKQQEEIERLKVYDNIKYQKYLYGNMEAEIEKKDKIIDLMTRWIYHHTRYYDEDGCYCELIHTICNKDVECEECIKQYFKKKAEEENERI